MLFYKEIEEFIFISAGGPTLKDEIDVFEALCRLVSTNPDISVTIINVIVSVAHRPH